MTRKMETRLPARGSTERSAHRVAPASAPLDAAQARRPYRKQAQRIIATLVPPLAALAFAAALTAPARALTVQEQGWQIANSKCQAGDAKECDLRDRLSNVLKRKGCSYQEDGGWWKCNRAH